MARAPLRAAGLRRTVWGELLAEFLGTAFLLMFVLALTDQRNQPPKSNLAPLLVGPTVAAIGMSFGANAGPPSTRPATSARGSSPGWPAGAGWRCPACTATSGCRSSGL
jgi:hypothetical protein